MSKKINLWASPRNVSTAIMYSFAQRKDTRVIDEPFYASYLNSTGIIHPGQEEILASQSTDFHEVLKQVIFKDYARSVVFFKQMSHHLLDHDKSFLLDCENIVLIREPQSMIRSFNKVIPKPRLSDLGLEDSYGIYNYLKSKNQRPIVLDSGDLCENPKQVIQKLCERLEIEYEPSMLNWAPGPRAEDGIWAKHWYGNVHRSSAFSKQEKNLEELPVELLPLLEECTPLYLALQEEKIHP